jgi:hypothetical protein
MVMKTSQMMTKKQTTDELRLLSVPFIVLPQNDGGVPSNIR